MDNLTANILSARMFELEEKIKKQQKRIEEIEAALLDQIETSRAHLEALQWLMKHERGIKPNE